MFALAVILVPFLAGLLGGALVRGSKYRRLFFFLVLVCTSTALFNVPFLLETLGGGLPPLDWQTLIGWSAFQGFVFLFVGFVTAFGWLCSYCIQKTFED